MFSAPPPAPVFVQHPARPSWGRCLIAAEHDGKIYLHAEDGQEHVVAVTHRAQLVVVTPDEDEFPLLMARIQGRRSAAGGKQSKQKRSTRPKAPQLSFDEQVQRFLTTSLGGFTAPPDPAIARAQSLLSVESLSRPEAFAQVQTLVSETGLLHPMEGQIPLRAISEAHRGSLVASLKELLHGSGDYASRYDRWIAIFIATKSEGGAKGPSWPLSTLLPALYAPKEHVFVKPKLFQQQAKILALPLDYSSLPSGAVYEQFRAIVRTLAGKLSERGQTPRDLLDVCSFISLTLSAAKG